MPGNTGRAILTLLNEFSFRLGTRPMEDGFVVVISSLFLV